MPDGPNKQRYTAKLFRLAYYYTKNLHTAEDIVQEIFLKFYQKKLILEENEVERYLMKMTVNKAKDYLRSWPILEIISIGVFIRGLMLKKQH